MSSSDRDRGGAIVDIDGTLVDTNYQHTIAWARALAHHGVTVPLWRIHRHTGMGGDQLVSAVAGDQVEAELGDAIRETEGTRYGELIDEVRPFAGGRALLEGLHALGYRVMLASSAKPEEVDHYLDLLDARGLVDGWTTGADVEQTKPHPDLVSVARERLGATECHMMIGDTTWDAIAAGRAGVPTIGVLSGGFGEDELRDAGCDPVYADAGALAADLERACERAKTRAQG